MLGVTFIFNIGARLRSLAQESIQEQQRIEAAYTMPFEIYREKYLSAKRLRIRSSLTGDA